MKTDEWKGKSTATPNCTTAIAFGAEFHVFVLIFMLKTKVQTYSKQTVQTYSKQTNRVVPKCDSAIKQKIINKTKGIRLRLSVHKESLI